MIHPRFNFRHFSAAKEFYKYLAIPKGRLTYPKILGCRMGQKPTGCYQQIGLKIMLLTGNIAF